MDCKYHRQCDIYDSTSGTCQSRNAEEGYCGRFRRYDEARVAEKEEFKRGLRALNVEYEGLLSGSNGAIL